MLNQQTNEQSYYESKESNVANSICKFTLIHNSYLMHYLIVRLIDLQLIPDRFSTFLCREACGIDEYLLKVLELIVTALQDTSKLSK
jgi:hypothetical protein